MSIFQRFPFLRFTLFFALGIVSRHYLGEVVLLPLPIVFGFFLAYLIFLRWNSLRFQYLLSILSFVLLFSFGALRLDFYLVKNDSLDQRNILAYKAQLITEPEQKENSIRAVLEVYDVLIDTSWVKLNGRVNAYFDKEVGANLTYGDLVLLQGNPVATAPPANPGEFDYSNYLTYQNIRFQQFAGDKFQLIGHSAPNPFVEKSIPIRDYCARQVMEYIPNAKARAVILALVLGVKDELDNELIQSFSATGAMHVLAVSGLHVGIIYAIIFGLLKYLRLHRRKYRWWMAIISVSILWCYALITGLSPSVLRAVTMFTFVALGRALFRKGNIYNTLSLSALALLLFNPYLIMSVGFQLSFLAVFGIVFLHPKIYGLLVVNNWLLDKIWSITCVSIAAQVATGPLSMLYFHQFPTYFLLSNLFIIPAAFAILIGGLVLLATSWFPFLAIAVGWLLNGFVKAINWLVFMASQLPNSTIDGIYFSILDTWLVYAMLVGLIFYSISRRLKYLKLSLVCAMAFAISQIGHFTPYSTSYELSVLDVNNGSVIDFRVGHEGLLIADEEFLKDPERQKFHLHGKRLIAGVEQQHYLDQLTVASQKLPYGELAVFEGKSILWLNQEPSMSINETEKMTFDFMVISNNSVRSLPKILNQFEAKQIILDKSNSFYIQQKLMQEAKEYELSIHQVATNGYFSSLWKP